jgi:hypothetical protein
MARLRQAVIAAGDLDATADTLRAAIGLGEPYSDPGVERFGLRNAVFALGDTFLEVVSPIRPDTSAGRLLDRRGGDCGYMLMFQVEDLEAARGRVREEGVREVFEVSLPDIEEVHLHPSDMHAAIVSLSSPHPPESWRWGGPDWQRRSAPLRLAGATITERHPVTVAARWQAILDGELGRFGILVSADERDRGLTEIILSVPRDRQLQRVDRPPLEIGGVRFVLVTDEE